MPQNDRLLAIKIPSALEAKLISLYPEVRERNNKIREILRNLVDSQNRHSLFSNKATK